jgi:hypothetical protein
MKIAVKRCTFGRTLIPFFGDIFQGENVVDMLYTTVNNFSYVFLCP